MKAFVYDVHIDKVGINCNSLSRPADSNDIVIVTLKKKAVYCSHALFEPGRPSFIRNFLEYWIKNNHLYSDIRVNMNKVSLTLQCFVTDEDVDTDTVITELLRCPSETLEAMWESSANDRLLGNESSLAEFKVSSNETPMIAENLFQ